MFRDVPSESRAGLLSLFAGYESWRAVIAAALEGRMGRVYADDSAAPSIGLIRLAFDDCFLAGDASLQAVEALSRLVTGPSYIVAPELWQAPLQAVYGARLSPRRRVSFGGFHRDPLLLRALREALPRGYDLVRADAANIRAYARFSSALVANYTTLEEFLREGAGFGVTYLGHFIAGASSYAVGEGKLEFEVQTHPDFRRRGFAAAASAALLEYCFENGLEPCWDAANEASATLATKLGFTQPRPYQAYEISTAGR